MQKAENTYAAAISDIMCSRDNRVFRIITLGLSQRMVHYQHSHVQLFLVHHHPYKILSF